jgi:periplasmic protein CpxP/Spy
MKKHFLFILVILLAGTTIANAQNMPRRSPEERTKRVVDTLVTVFKLDKAHADQADSVFLNYYKEVDKMRESMQGGNFDRDAFMKLASDRDEKLKKVLSEAEFKKFKEEIEPAMRPQRRQGGGNR